MNRGRARQAVFPGETYHETFLDCLSQAHRRFGMEVHAYCLMGNHYHLLLRTPKANLSRVMRHVNGVYTQHYNRLKGTDGPLFRGRYKAMNVEAANYLLEVSRYIHQNPVETKRALVEQLVGLAIQYPVYRKKIKAPKWLHRDVVLAELGSGQATAAYARFVERGVDKELSAFYAKGRWPAVLGSKAFVERASLTAQTDSKEIRRAKSYLPFERVIQAVADHYGCDVSQVVAGRRGVRNEMRGLAMKLAQEETGETLERLAMRFGVGSYGAVSQAIARTKCLMEADRGVMKRYLDISRDLPLDHDPLISPPDSLVFCDALED